MYEMFTGAVPFTGETFLGVLTKHLNEAPPAMNVVFPELTISPELQAVIMRALVKDPAVRYQSMLEFAQAISGTPDAAALGYRAMQSSMAEHSLSYVPHAPGNPTHQQFAPSTPPPPPPGASTPAPALHALKLTGQETTAARAETLIGAEANTRPPAARSNGGAIAIASIALLALGRRRVVHGQAQRQHEPGARNERRSSQAAAPRATCARGAAGERRTGKTCGERRHCGANERNPPRRLQ